MALWDLKTIAFHFYWHFTEHPSFFVIRSVHKSSSWRHINKSWPTHYTKLNAGVKQNVILPEADALVVLGTLLLGSIVTLKHTGYHVGRHMGELIRNAAFFATKYWLPALGHWPYLPVNELSLQCRSPRMLLQGTPSRNLHKMCSPNTQSESDTQQGTQRCPHSKSTVHSVLMNQSISPR